MGKLQDASDFVETKYVLKITDILNCGMSYPTEEYIMDNSFL